MASYLSNPINQGGPLSASISSPLISVEAGMVAESARLLLQSGRRDVVVTRLPFDEASLFLQSVQIAACDLDGTLLEAGSTVFPDEVPSSIKTLATLGVEVFGVTGKPLSEITALLRSISSDVPFKPLFEKGAYYLERSSDGATDFGYLLATPESENAISQLKKHFYGEDRTRLVTGQWPGGSYAREIEDKHRVMVVPAGDGSHQAVLSLDILDPALLHIHGAENDYADPKHKDRNHLKVQNPPLLQDIFRMVTEMVRSFPNDLIQKASVVDLGNSNFEVAAAKIEKDLAVHQLAAKGKVLVVGDSGNDAPMFRVAQDIPHQVRSCLVFHEKTPESLLEMVDFCVVGAANGVTMLNSIIYAKHHSDDGMPL